MVMNACPVCGFNPCICTGKSGGMADRLVPRQFEPPLGGQTPDRRNEAEPYVLADDRAYVPDELHKKASLFASRNEEYGNAYVKFGEFLHSMLAGQTIDTRSPAELARLGTFILWAGKLHRYGLNFSKGGHLDSADDASVYAMMQKHVDAIAKEQK